MFAVDHLSQQCFVSSLPSFFVYLAERAPLILFDISFFIKRAAAAFCRFAAFAAAAQNRFT
jgi:hypothetical protein